MLAILTQAGRVIMGQHGRCSDHLLHTATYIERCKSRQQIQRIFMLRSEHLGRTDHAPVNLLTLSDTSTDKAVVVLYCNWARNAAFTEHPLLSRPAQDQGWRDRRQACPFQFASSTRSVVKIIARPAEATDTFDPTLDSNSHPNKLESDHGVITSVIRREGCCHSLADMRRCHEEDHWPAGGEGAQKTAACQ
jgi:hypothetical protein